MVKRYGFSKEEKLKSRKSIDELFAKGKSFTVSPVRVSYKFSKSPDFPTLQAGVTVSKKYFKKAVDRNRIKRFLREAYRLQKNDLKELTIQSGVTGHVFFMYNGKEIENFQVIMGSMNKCLLRLQKIVNETHS
ncbi:MAG: ribonuclease P protein component [Flavisolibacter sp.]